MDEHIACPCGYSFYAFGNIGMSIVMPSREIQNPSLARAFRKMIVSSGRCLDAEVVPEAVDYTAVLREASPDRLMDVALARLQEETYGNKILETKHVEVLCEELSKGHDVAIRSRKDRIVMNRLDPKDIMAEWEKGRAKIPRAGDHYRPGEPAAWQREKGTL